MTSTAPRYVIALDPATIEQGHQVPVLAYVTSGDGFKTWPRARWTVARGTGRTYKTWATRTGAEGFLARHRDHGLGSAVVLPETEV